ncbi:hypothetical protein EGW08_018517, partial [Elysia chlorotica]
AVLSDLSSSSSSARSAQRVDHSGQQVEVALELTGGRAHSQVEAAREDVQTSERTTGRALAGSVFPTTLGGAAVSTATRSSASLATNASNGVTQVAEDLRESTRLLLDGALSVADVRARGGVGGVAEEGDDGQNCEGLHRGVCWAWCELVQMSGLR